MLKKLVILTFAVTSLVACSDSERSQQAEDAQKHQKETAIFADGTVEVEEARPEVIQTAMQSLFYINPKSSLIFVQGENKKVYFDVRLAFADLDGLRYNIKMTDGPTSLGASFGRDNGGYYLQWNPSLNILSNQEDSKDYKISLEFGLDADSSRSNKRELSGQDLKREYWVTLIQNRTQPVISNVTYSAADQTLNPGGSGSITFNVDVTGAHNRADISAGIIPASKNDDTPVRELVQMSGVPAVTSVPALVSSTDIGGGTTRYVYRVNFDADLMIDHAIRKIEADPTLKARMATNRINTAEGVFAVEAYNSGNGRRSQQKKVMYKVNLTPEVGNAVLNGYESMTFVQGAGDGINFQLRSAGKKGSISETHEIPEVDGLNIDLNCNPRSEMSNKAEGCYSGVCVLDCRMKATASCDAAPGQYEVPVKATTKLYENEREAEFKIRVRVNANPAYCTGGQS